MASAETPVQTIARRLREVRRRRDLTAQEVADRLQDLGINWDRTTVAKVETGRRESVGAAELLALGLALDCSPLSLLLPMDNRPYAVTPARTEPADVVRAWLRGQQALPGTDELEYMHELPVCDLQARVNASSAEVHARITALAEQVEELARQLRQQA